MAKLSSFLFLFTRNNKERKKNYWKHYEYEQNFWLNNLQGLFSRITFREPVFLGGTGNITGLAKRLPVYDGMTGCIRKFIANEHEYVFAMTPAGDTTKGFDVRKYT